MQPITFFVLAHEKLVDLLLQNGANINAQDKNLHTPLHVAVRNGNIGILSRFIYPFEN